MVIVEEILVEEEMIEHSHSLPKPQHVTSFGSRIVVDVIIN